MGCFFACFGSSKDAKRVKYHRDSHLRDQESTIQRNAIPKPLQSSLYTLPDDSNKPSHPVLEVGNKREWSLNISTTEKVTCDSNSKPLERVPLEEADSVHGKKQDEEEEEEESSAKGNKPESSSEDFAVPPSLTSSCPPTGRYRNCKDSDDENDFFDSHLNDEFGMVESRREISCVADRSMYVCGLNRKNARLRTAYIFPLLNPVENLSQWNAVKSKGRLPPTSQKENLKLEQESTVEEFSCISKPSQELGVDASLSNWLASSETTPASKITTTMALEDTFTPVKATLQGSSSPRGSLGAMPTIGMVGTYLRQGVSDKEHDSASSFKGIPNTCSKYREDRTVNWHSTPFETRLERALNSGTGVAKA